MNPYPPRPLARRLFTAMAHSLQRARKAMWKVTGRPVGVHAVPITRMDRVVLVQLTYASGWRLPGGGKKRGETPEEGVLRELREEIGLTACKRMWRLGGTGEDPALGVLFAVEGAEYQPKPSWEIEAVREFGLDALPASTTARTARWIARYEAERTNERRGAARPTATLTGGL